MIEVLTTWIIPAAGYFLCLAALTTAAWLATCYAISDRCRGGLRLALVLIGHFALNAVVVQSLGLLGRLRLAEYLVTCALMGGASIWTLRRRFPGRSMLKLIRHQVELWLPASPYGLGWLGLAVLVYMTFRCGLVEGVDSMSIHGPMIVEWLQAESIHLLWRYNYPLCWEYQFAANFLIMGSDLLVVVPRIGIVLTLLLIAKEIGRQMGLRGGLCQLAAWISVLTPLALGVYGEWSLKNDVPLAVGMLACLLGIDRLWRNLPGGLWSLLLGVFLTVGTKSTGILLGAGFLVLGLAIGCWHHRKELKPKRVAWILMAVILLQATPFALPIVNTVENGSPFYPIVLKIGDWIELPGEARMVGTSILEHKDDPGIWRILWLGAAKRIGFEALLVFPLFVLGFLSWLGRWVLLGIRGGPVRALTDHRLLPLALYATAAATLFLIFLATPWTAGVGPESIRFVKSGTSLRYTLAAVVLIYLGAVAFLRDVLGPKAVQRLLIILLPVVFFRRWSPSIFYLSREGFGDPNLLIVGFLGLVALFWWLGKWLPTIDRALRSSRLGEAGWPAVVLAVLLCALPVYAELMDRFRWRQWAESTNPSAAFRKVWTHVWKSLPPGSPIACNSKPPNFNFAYFLYGPKLDNRLVEAGSYITGPEQDLPSEIEHYFVTYQPAQPQRLQTSIEMLKSKGWSTVARVDGNVGALMRRRTPAAQAKATGQ